MLARCDGGYTTNLPLADVTGGKAWVAFMYDGAPLPPEHGGPARLLVPHLYFWKSAKWVRELRLMESDAPGFWESLGYHNYGDPMARAAIRRRRVSSGWQHTTNCLAARHRDRRCAGDAEDADARPRCAGMARPPRRTTRGRATHGRRRLSGGAQLLNRVGAGRPSSLTHRRAAERRRSLTIPLRRAALRG